MLNRFPLWKNLLVALVVIVGFLYSAPNLYGEDPALQVSAARGAEVQASTLDSVKKVLEANGLKFKSALLDKGRSWFALPVLMISSSRKSLFPRLLVINSSSP